MTGRIASSLAADPSPRVRAAVMVDRWVTNRFQDTLGITDGELFERALVLQRETDYITGRCVLPLPLRFIASPFEKIKKTARRRLLGRLLP